MINKAFKGTIVYQPPLELCSPCVLHPMVGSHGGTWDVPHPMVATSSKMPPNPTSAIQQPRGAFGVRT